MSADASWLADGTRWRTRCHRLSAGRGPVVFVVAGMHGNELAPVAALERVKSWQLRAGRLVLVPRANVPALDRRTRLAPGTRHSNLNRNFPEHARDVPRGAAARALWQALVREAPEFVIDLHEGVDFRRRNRRSVGNSVLCASVSGVKPVAEAVATAVNATIPDESQHFVQLGPPARGSLVRAAAECRGMPGMLIETTRSQPFELRVEQHLLMLRVALERLGVA